MDDAEIDVASFKKKLLSLRDDVLKREQAGQEAVKPVELDQSRVGRLSRMDALQGQAMARESQQRRLIQKQRIDSALERIENNTFGLCVRCENMIHPKRLDFDPATPLCIDCAERQRPSRHS